MNELDVLYLRILHHGLRILRDSASVGDLERLAVESEHLHNLPSLIGESNIHRHLYYANRERVAYLQWVNSCHRAEVVEFVESFYVPSWNELALLLAARSEDNLLGDEPPVIFRQHRE